MTERPDIRQTDARPVVKIRPGKGKRLADGAPWAYADEVVLDRRTRALAPGTIVRLVDGEDSHGAAAFNPVSKIAARLLDPDPEARIDRDWLGRRIDHALALREALHDAPFYRLVHAEGDGLPGLVVDRFGGALVLQPNAAWVDVLLEPLIDALVASTGAETIIVNATSRARKLEGLEGRLEVVRGSLNGPLPVAMNGAQYMADLTGGQKTGLFFDQRPNHAEAAGLIKGGRMLDVFTHVGGFALAALVRQPGVSALAVDSSAPALALAEEGARRSGVADRFETLRQDAFAELGALAAEGARFELVVADPPAFAPSKSALPQGLRAYERLARLAAGVVAPGGWLVLCSCSHAADPESFHRANARGIARAGRSAQLVRSGRAGPDHPSHVALPETSYLKALTYRLDG